MILIKENLIISAYKKSGRYFIEIINRLDPEHVYINQTNKQTYKNFIKNFTKYQIFYFRTEICLYYQTDFISFIKKPINQQYWFILINEFRTEIESIRKKNKVLYTLISIIFILILINLYFFCNLGTQ